MTPGPERGDVSGRTPSDEAVERALREAAEQGFALPYTARVREIAPEAFEGPGRSLTDDEARALRASDADAERRNMEAMGAVLDAAFPSGEQPGGEHCTYIDCIEGGHAGYRGACETCGWRGPTHAASVEGKNAARVDHIEHMKDNDLRSSSEYRRAISDVDANYVDQKRSAAINWVAAGDLPRAYVKRIVAEVVSDVVEALRGMVVKSTRASQADAFSRAADFVERRFGSREQGEES